MRKEQQRRDEKCGGSRTKANLQSLKRSSATNAALLIANKRLRAEVKIHKKAKEKLLMREQQYRAITRLLIKPVNEMESLLKNILRNAIDLVAAQDAFVGLYDKKNNVIKFRYAIGMHEEILQKVQLVLTGMQKKVFSTGELFWVEDYSTYSLRLKDPRLSQVSTVVVLPLKSEDRITGFLSLCWFEEIHKMNIEDVQGLSQFADLISLATERIRNMEKINKMAFQDQLTGLPNRANLKFFLETEMVAAQRGIARGVVLFIDLDELKAINDNFGHSVGDEIIIIASRYILEVVGDKSFVSRIGGDEFIVVLPRQADKKILAGIISELLKALAQVYCVAKECFHLTASIGVAIYPDDGNNTEEILKKADAAMYVAKATGGNCWRYYEPSFSKDVCEKLKLTTGLRYACERKELFLYYQAQVSTDEQKIAGFEALLRWNSKEHGFILPERFVPLAERSGLIVEIGHFVLQEACLFAKRLAEQGHEDIRVAVNISPCQLLHSDFIDNVKKLIAAVGIYPAQLEMEITENALIESLEESIDKLEQLKMMGIRLALDDFGTGYSSLNYLRSLPVEILKIDKSFIEHIVDDELQRQILGRIIGLGHALGMEVVAEGVENQEQLQLLTELACERIQGYIFSQPVPEAKALQLLQEKQEFRQGTKIT